MRQYSFAERLNDMTQVGGHFEGLRGHLSYLRRHESEPVPTSEQDVLILRLVVSIINESS